jgi:hypothetical protein
MIGLHFFDVPVYRLPEGQYYVERNRYVERWLFGETEAEHEMKTDFYDRNPDQAIKFRDHLERSYGGAWIFNEIVGYIRLYFLQNQILGELWMVNAKRLVRTRKKTFVWKTWKVVAEIDIPCGSNSDHIYKLILGYLDDAQSELRRYYRRCYVDKTTFVRIGPYVDWNRLLREHQRSSKGQSPRR